MVLKISTVGNAAKTERENINGEIFTLRQGCTNHGHPDSAKKYILPFPPNICVVLSLELAHVNFLPPKILRFILDLGEIYALLL
jgi:hypothetical protein